METPEIQSTEDLALLATSDAPRVLAGLQSGRLVNFVMSDHSVRPFLVVIAGDATGPVNGVLFMDGPADRQLCPRPIAPEGSGHQPEVAVRIVDVPYDESGEPGSWNWPTKQPVIAAGIDANAINTAVALMMEPVVKRMRQQIADDVQERVDAALESVNKLLDSHSGLLADTLAKIKHPVLQMSGRSDCNRCVVTIDDEGRAFHELSCPDSPGAEIVQTNVASGGPALAADDAALMGAGAMPGTPLKDAHTASVESGGPVNPQDHCQHKALRADRTCISCGAQVPASQAEQAEGQSAV